MSKGKNNIKKSKTNEKPLSNKIKNFFYDDLDDDFHYKSTFSIFEVVIIILISILFGVILGYIITYSRNPISEARSNVNLTEVVNTYNDIVDNYYGKVDEDVLSEVAIKAMIESLDDPYSNFMDIDTTNNFNETIDGSFIGIGVVAAYEDEYNVIIDVIEGSPAEKAGLKVDDVIIKVDKKSAHKMNGYELSKLVKGKIGTKIKITVKRDDKEKEITVKRDLVELNSVTNNIFDYEGLKIGYVKIDSFASNSYNQFKKAIRRMDKNKIDSLIIDVRDNPGGHLQQTREILSMFFPENTVLYQIESKNEKSKIRSITSDTKEYPVAVLINSGSASASEILASCFQENYKNAIIVGTKSYGKGTVQKSQNLSGGTSIKYTVQKWLTSKGKWINNKGIIPDVEVEQVSEKSDFNNDAQLQEALKQLKESK